MKITIAGKFYNSIEYAENITVKQFYQNSCLKITNKDMPNIDLYLIIDKIKEEEFKNNFDFFKSLLKHWFEKVGARLHVIGYNKK